MKAKKHTFKLDFDRNNVLTEILGPIPEEQGGLRSISIKNPESICKILDAVSELTPYERSLLAGLLA